MYLADIRAQDYESFQRIPTLGLPNTFNEWGYALNQHFAQIQGGGNQPIKVEVYPDEFAVFCRNTGAPTNLHGLNNFATEKAARQGKAGG
jgi:hypothetical protein